MVSQCRTWFCQVPYPIMRMISAPSDVDRIAVPVSSAAGSSMIGSRSAARMSAFPPALV